MLPDGNGGIRVLEFQRTGGFRPQYPGASVIDLRGDGTAPTVWAAISSGLGVPGTALWTVTSSGDEAVVLSGLYSESGTIGNFPIESTISSPNFSFSGFSGGHLADKTHFTKGLGDNLSIEGDHNLVFGDTITSSQKETVGDYLTAIGTNLTLGDAFTRRAYGGMRFPRAHFFSNNDTLSVPDGLGALILLEFQVNGFFVPTPDHITVDLRGLDIAPDVGAAIMAGLASGGSVIDWQVAYSDNDHISYRATYPIVGQNAAIQASISQSPVYEDFGVTGFSGARIGDGVDRSLIAGNGLRVGRNTHHCIALGSGDLATFPTMGKDGSFNVSIGNANNIGSRQGESDRAGSGNVVVGAFLYVGENPKTSDTDPGASRNVVVGYYSTSNSNDSVAIGSYAQVRHSSNPAGVAIGFHVTIDNGAHHSIAIGSTSTIGPGAYNSLAIGDTTSIGSGTYNSLAIGTAVSVGSGSHDAIALGNAITKFTGNTYTTALGMFIQEQGGNTRAQLVGFNITCSGGSTYVSSFGDSLTSGSGSIYCGLFGYNISFTNATDTYAFGKNISCGGGVGQHVLIGSDVHVSSGVARTVAIGYNVNLGSSVSDSVCIGSNLSASNRTALVVIGSGITTIAGNGTVTIGLSAANSSDNAVVIGISANVGSSSGQGIAIGAGATINSSSVNCVAVGAGANIGAGSNACSIINGASVGTNCTGANAFGNGSSVGHDCADVINFDGDVGHTSQRIFNALAVMPPNSWASIQIGSDNRIFGGPATSTINIGNGVVLRCGRTASVSRTVALGYTINLGELLVDATATIEVSGPENFVDNDYVVFPDGSGGTITVEYQTTGGFVPTPGRFTVDLQGLTSGDSQGVSDATRTVVVANSLLTAGTGSSGGIGYQQPYTYVGGTLGNGQSITPFVTAGASAFVGDTFADGDDGGPSSDSVAIGSYVTTGANCNYVVAIGRDVTVDTDVIDSIAIGRGAHSTVSHECVIGAGTADTSISIFTVRGYNGTALDTLKAINNPASGETGLSVTYNDGASISNKTLKAAVSPPGGSLLAYFDP